MIIAIAPDFVNFLNQSFKSDGVRLELEAGHVNRVRIKTPRAEFSREVRDHAELSYLILAVVESHRAQARGDAMRRAAA